MRLSEAGEFGLIHRIQKIVQRERPDLVQAIGDDTAIVQAAPGREQLLTTDALVEGVHFDLDYTPMETLGWKALAINISDIAAMGGRPLYALVTLALSKDWSVGDIEILYHGMSRCGDQFGCAIVGGDTVHSPHSTCISVTVIGDVPVGKSVRRNGAQAGDLICVTGELGGSLTGLEVLMSGENKAEYKKSTQHFLTPIPRLNEAQAIVKEFSPTAMIDISDGLASEIGHLCENSGLGCLVRFEDIPLIEESRQWAEQSNAPIEKYAFQSGEEYELLFTVEKDRFIAWSASEGDNVGIPISVIGEMTAGKNRICLYGDGRDAPLPGNGWDHFLP